MNWIHALIPNLNTLHALISLKKTGSITKTADALSLTQSAISHKIKRLEDQLGFAILKRDGRGIRLTPRAHAYIAEISPALDTLERASSPDQIAGQLRLNVAPGFASSWLVQRLPRFQHLHPDLQITFNTASGYGDLGELEDDVYISFATKEQMPASAIKLMHVSFFIVSAPHLTGGRRLANLSELSEYPLLHLIDRMDWQDWLSRSDQTHGTVPKNVLFQDLQTYLAAARSGVGIALGDTLTCEASLSRGELIRLHPDTHLSIRAYWMVSGSGTKTDAADIFETWLMREIEVSDQSASK